MSRGGISGGRVFERPSRGEGLNLARQPFRNLRPIVRLAVLLWLLGGVLLVINSMQYWGYFTGSEDRRAELEQLQDQVEEHRQDIGDLEARLGSLDLRRQNAEVRFLNHKISERVFSWSGLFDRLADVLPNDVRLVSLSPDTDRGASGRSRRADADDDLAEGEIRLGIVGVARTPEAQLEFIEALFAHPAFRNPDLSRDSISDGQIRFDMTTVYLPDGPASMEDSTEVAQAEAGEVAPVETSVENSTEPATQPAPTASTNTTATPSRAGEASRAEEATAATARAGTTPAARLMSTSVTGVGDPRAGQPPPAGAPSIAAPSAPRGPVGPVLQQQPSPSDNRASTPEPSVNPANRPLPRQPNASSSPGIR